MESLLRRQLQQLTADFYRFHADSFDESRKGAWDSWGRVWKEMLSATSISTLLDLGCGNGRFASFLNEQKVKGIEYTGVDAESSFIDLARERFPKQRFEVASLENAFTTPHRYDAIICFGVAHHVPGHVERTQLLKSMASILTPGGVAAISFWQPTRLKNFAAKVHTSHGIDGLERNDFLLGWKGDFTRVRYCHNFDDDEIQTLIADSPFECTSLFNGSNNDETNQYAILRKSHDLVGVHKRESHLVTAQTQGHCA